jgi:autotransporter translocation and assembly factor TamB
VTSLAVYAVYVTPTDVQGWAQAAGPLLLILLGAVLAAAYLERTGRGRRLIRQLADRLGLDLGPER